MANGAPVWVLLAASVVGLYGAEAAALPPVEPSAVAAGAILVGNQAFAVPATTTRDDQAGVPFAEINAALAAARAGLKELSKAAATVSQARQELSAAEQENERLRALIAKLEQRSGTAVAQVADRTRVGADGDAGVKRMETEPASAREHDDELRTHLARAEAAHDRTAAEARTAEAALSGKFETLTRSAEQLASEIARLLTASADSEQRPEDRARSDAGAPLADPQTKVQVAEAKGNRLDEHADATSRLTFTPGEALQRASVAGGGPMPARQVIDGDTLVVEGEHTRLFGVDAFEPRQTCLDREGRSWPCGSAAQAALFGLVQTGALACTVVADEPKDGYVARCTGRDGIDLGGYLVRAGLALADPDSGKIYLADQAAAKAAAVGAWDGTFTPPWQWRSEQRGK